MINSVVNTLYNIADKMIAGQYLGDAALAAVGACTGAFNLMIALISGLTGGMGIVTAQYFGAGRKIYTDVSCSDDGQRGR